MKHGPKLGALSAVCLYVFVYGALYHVRTPAANLAYWVYSERAPAWAEECVYYAFYPPYFLHQRVVGAGRHNYDRPEPRDAE